MTTLTKKKRKAFDAAAQNSGMRQWEPSLIDSRSRRGSEKEITLAVFAVVLKWARKLPYLNHTPFKVILDD